jgi:hypothetical protein
MTKGRAPLTSAAVSGGWGETRRYTGEFPMLADRML